MHQFDQVKCILCFDSSDRNGVKAEIQFNTCETTLKQLLDKYALTTVTKDV